MIDITGQKFNRLTAIEPVYKDKNGVWHWKFKCECGNEKVCNSARVKDGNIKSCGCLRKEKHITHGMRYTRIYKIYHCMKGRCYYPSNNRYKNYGARGIKICDEWLGKDGFVHFYEWAKSNGYNDNLSIDRIDVNGDYKPSNCRWATRTEQANNTTANCYYTYNNETHTVTDWGRMVGIDSETIRARIRRGWTVEDALTKPLDARGKKRRKK